MRSEKPASWYVWRSLANVIAIPGLAMAWPGLKLMDWADACELRARRAFADNLRDGEKCAVETITEICRNEKCPRGGVPVQIVAGSLPQEERVR